MRPYLFSKKRLFLLAVYLYASVLVMQLFLGRQMLDQVERTRLGDMVYGTAYRPFVGRVLVPMVLRGAAAVTPPSVRQTIAGRVSEQNALLPQALKDHRFLFEFGVFWVVAVLCFTGFLVALRASIPQLYPDLPRSVVDFGPVAALLLLPPFFYPTHLYDPATLLLSAGMLAALVRNRRAFFFALFFFACVNKETAALFIPVFVVRFWNPMKKPQLAFCTTALLAIWLCIKLMIRRTFAGNPGVDIEWHGQENLAFLLAPRVSALPLLLVVAFFLYFGLSNWRSKPLFVRQASVLLVIPIFATQTVWGLLPEIRVYFDAFPALFLLCLLTLYQKYQNGSRKQ